MVAVVEHEGAGVETGARQEHGRLGRAGAGIGAAVATRARVEPGTLATVAARAAAATTTATTAARQRHQEGCRQGETGRGNGEEGSRKRFSGHGR